ncbi:MAG: fibronectin type III domain-containing protein [Mangrovibacterium sp.]
MKHTLFTLVVATLLSVQCYSVQQQYNLSATPDRIMLSISGNPATSRAVSWRTVFDDTASVAQIALASPSPEFGKMQTTVLGTHAAWESGSDAAMGHQVVFENLQPETTYAYRVGDGENWSEWFQFKTASTEVKPFSFLYFGDVQNGIKSQTSRVIRQAYSHFPSSAFMLFVGDIVSESQEQMWAEFFYAGGWIYGMMPSVPTPGNHEYDKCDDGSRSFSKHWNQIYRLPHNAPTSEYMNRCYYMDYQGVRFVSFDSPAHGFDTQNSEMLLSWLDSVLAENPCKWTVVFTHYPVYSCSQGRTGTAYRDVLKPILEAHGVDLVLQGHDHTYCRGQQLANVSGANQNSPMYVVSVAGSKMSGLNTDVWSDRVGSDTQLYQHISISGDSLHYQSFQPDASLYDAFTIVKDAKGKNHIRIDDEVLEIPQRTQIPERGMENYSEEDLKVYQEMFGK